MKSSKNKSVKSSEVAEKLEAVQASPIGEAVAKVEDKAKLKKHEDIIRRNEKGAFAIGRSLGQINRESLYKTDEFTSFEAYCKQRWGMSDKHAYRLIEAAACYDTLADHQGGKNLVLPKNEAQVRPLIKLEEKKRIPAWEKVVTKFAGKPFTAEDIEELINPESVKAVEPAAGRAAAAEIKAAKKEQTALKKKLAKIDAFINKALEKVAGKKGMTVKEYQTFLNKIKALVTASE